MKITKITAALLLGATVLTGTVACSKSSDSSTPTTSQKSTVSSSKETSTKESSSSTHSEPKQTAQSISKKIRRSRSPSPLQSRFPIRRHRKKIPSPLRPGPKLRRLQFPSSRSSRQQPRKIPDMTAAGTADTTPPKTADTTATTEGHSGFVRGTSER